MTGFYKRVFPVFWFGFLSVFVLLIAATGLTDRNHRSAPMIIYLIPVIMMVVGYFIMRALVLDLMDEVYDCGEYLVIKNKGQETRIDLSNIINISYAGMTNPRRATLTLREPCSFGKTVTFSPKRQRLFDFNLFTNPAIDDLITRVDAARQKT